MGERKCEICGSTIGVTNYLNQGKLLCSKHQKHMRKYGKIKRTIYDKNEIRSYENYAEFDTYDINGDINEIFKIDLEFIDFIKQHKIYRHKDGYACYKYKNESNQNGSS